ncbi:hypothetical protein [Pseudidiomarina halophila]|uniref:hypothetical protein n=1 Tax=Pseudidiomarina halophila TaxID=1449799 RepID=UPI003620E187
MMMLDWRMLLLLLALGLLLFILMLLVLNASYTHTRTLLSKSMACLPGDGSNGSMRTPKRKMRLLTLLTY